MMDGRLTQAKTGKRESPCESPITTKESRKPRGGRRGSRPPPASHPLNPPVHQPSSRSQKTPLCWLAHLPSRLSWPICSYFRAGKSRGGSTIELEECMGVSLLPCLVVRKHKVPRQSKPLLSTGPATGWMDRPPIKADN